MSDVFKMVHKLSVKVNKETDSAILGEIQSIAIENGVCDEIVLNEKAIIRVIVKSQKKKVIYSNDSYVYCPNCRASHKLHLLSGLRPDYCPDCGQALEWEV